MTKALVIIDIQNDYFRGGKMELVGSEEAAKNASLILEDFRAKNLPVIHVRQESLRPIATFFLPGTEGAEIHQAVKPENDETVIVKNHPNSFKNTELQKLLDSKSITELTLVGMMTHMCIDTTVRAASDLDYQVTLVGDACATRDLEFDGKIVPAAQVQAAYLAAIDGSFATVVATDSIPLSR
jgi:nicotinamidase-related amidase